jgi:ribonucleoside-triphosphate reductase
VKADGTRESWDDTVRRVVKGNLSLVSRERTLPGEEEDLYNLIYNFRVLPAGRHLWMSGVEGRQFLFNCYVSGWGDSLSDHFAFTFNQLMEGGGVGSNYSHEYVNGQKYPIYNLVRVHVVCSPEHDNYQDLLEAGLLSSDYTNSWTGAYEVDDSREGWTEALRRVIDTAGTYQPSNAEYDSSAGQYLPELVFDVSNIRAAGKLIKTFGGTSAGPVPFARMIKDIGHLLGAAWESEMNGPIAMEMDHAIATCVVSGNVRRSARMSIMRWDDPWIDWFLSCKESGLSHWSTNISVEIDDEFVDFVGRTSNDGDPRADRARRVYKAIVSGMLNNGEPGFWNSDYANEGEPNRVIATNPCGEIALEPWENCNLGHVNLDAFVGSNGSVDYDGLSRAHLLITRFLIRATYGDITDQRTSSVVLRNRRIGVGHFGYAGFVAKQQIKFSESWRSKDIQLVLSQMKQVVRDAATSYAHELRIPVPVKTTTVAPTGTIAKLAGRSEGIHPVYARYFIRRIRFSTVDENQKNQLARYAEQGYNIVEDPSTPYTMVVEIPTKEALVAELEQLGIDPSYLESVDEISLYDMLKVQEMYQSLWADNAVSYTINLNPDLITEAELAATLLPFLGTLKGSTIFPERGYVLPPYERVGKEVYELLRGSQDVLDDSYDEACASGACPVK